MDVTIYGSGYVGLVTGACLAQVGNNVLCVDIDPRKIGNRIAGVPVVPPTWLARASRPFVLGYVTNHGARDRIAASLRIMGYQRGRDYLMVG